MFPLTVVRAPNVPFNLLHRNNYFGAGLAHLRKGTAREMTNQNLPANCQAQDISNYRFPLLRATRLRTLSDRHHFRGASIVGWLTHDGRCKVGITLANNG
jgi:hypothetical protein